MADDFRLEDAIAEFRGLPEFLQTSKEAETWLCESVIKLRLKQCGREEIAWVLGIPVETLNEALPSSAASSLMGVELSDLGFVPRGSGCLIQGCRSLAHLNGRKCTLTQDLKDGATHAMVIVEGGTEEEMGAGEPGAVIGIARKNLELALAPEDLEDSAYPQLSLAPEAPPSSPKRKPEDYLGESRRRNPPFPEHLQGRDALPWLANVVGRLAESKECGLEEVAYLLGLSVKSMAGSQVPRSVNADFVGQPLTELAFVPRGCECVVEGSNSRADLNGHKALMLDHCQESDTHARIIIHDTSEELQIARKNLVIQAVPGDDAEAEIQKAKARAEQLAKEEAERRRKEEEEQQKRREEEQRKKAEEEERRKSDEEARRKAEEAAAREAKEEADRKEQEVARRIEEEVAASLQRKEKEEAERKAAEERERQLKAEVDRKVQEQLAQRAAKAFDEEAARRQKEAAEQAVSIAMPPPQDAMAPMVQGTDEGAGGGGDGLWFFLGCGPCCNREADDKMATTVKAANYWEENPPAEDLVHPSQSGAAEGKEPDLPRRSPSQMSTSSTRSQGPNWRPSTSAKAPADPGHPEPCGEPAPSGATVHKVGLRQAPDAEPAPRKKSMLAALGCLCGGKQPASPRGKPPAASPAPAPAAPAPPAADSGSALTGELRTLVQMKAEGLLTEEEFAAAKARLLR